MLSRFKFPDELKEKLVSLVVFQNRSPKDVVTKYGLPIAISPQKISGGVTLRNGITSGQLTGKIKAAKGAKSYLFEIAAGPVTKDSIWEVYNSSRYPFTLVT